MSQSLSENAHNLEAQLQALIQLQSIDDQIQKRKSQIADLNKQLETKREQVQTAATDRDQHRHALEQLLKDRRQAELQAQEKQEQIKKLGGQLFEVKTNEAYSTLQHEIQQKKQEQGLLEERILEMMLVEDDAKARIQQAEEIVKGAEQQVHNEQSENTQSIQALEKEIQSLEKDWEQAARAVTPPHLDLYKRLRRGKGGKALAKIENDICTGCRLSIRPQATIELKKYRTLLMCDNCARILYVDS